MHSTMIKNIQPESDPHSSEPDSAFWDLSNHCQVIWLQYLKIPSAKLEYYLFRDFYEK